MSFLFKKHAPARTTRLFFATDLHASERTFRKFINAAKAYSAQVLVLGGDVLGKVTVAIVREPNGKYRATYGGRTDRATTQAELKQLQDRLGLLGCYYRVMDAEELRALESDPAAVEQLFFELARERLAQWIDWAETRLHETGIRCYITGGNDDDPAALAVLNDVGLHSVLPCEDRLAPLDDQHTMISLGYSTPTPWHTPREVSEEELGSKIETLAANVPDMSRCVFNFHDPPKDSTLDICPMLDWSTDPPKKIVKQGQVVMHGAGSASVRRAIEQYQPLLGLHGHIHESPGAKKIGRTLCLNPGSEYSEGILRGALVNLSDGRIVSYQMTVG